jgi:cell division protein YceG involved in septum cleavage
MFFSQDKLKGKTFEYDLVLHNPSLALLVTEVMSNKEEIKALMGSFSDNKSVGELLNILKEGTEKTPHNKNAEIKQGICECKWADDDKRAAIIASRYLNSITKGENALELAYALENNLMKKEQEDYEEFVVPAYIKDALEWICR